MIFPFYSATPAIKVTTVMTLTTIMETTVMTVMTVMEMMTTVMETTEMINTATQMTETMKARMTVTKTIEMMNTNHKKYSRVFKIDWMCLSLYSYLSLTMETAIVVLTAILALTWDQEYQQQDPGVIVLPLILPLSNKHSDHIDDTDLLIMYINYRLWLTRIKRISCQLYGEEGLCNYTGHAADPILTYHHHPPCATPRQGPYSF